MKYSYCPTAFKVRHWRHLYDQCIYSLEGLNKIASSAVFVVFDAEPWGEDNTQAAELGISILRVSDISQTDEAIVTLDDFINLCAVETHWIQIIGRQPSKKPEKQRFGKQHILAACDAERHIISLLDSYRQRCSSAESNSLADHIVFVGFDLQFEFQLLSKVYTSLTSYFTAWLDLQELARLASRTEKPGLSETLKSCGFGFKDPRDLHSLCGKHNPATDTLRTAAILQYFLQHNNPVLEIATSNRSAKIYRRKSRGPPANAPGDRQLWFGAKLKPKELYPYTARVRLSTDDVLIPKTLLETFSEHKPVAVGCAKQQKNRYGWICLSSLSSLNHFINQIDGSQHCQGGAWIVVSDYDPKTIPAKDMRELKERLHAQSDDKRANRRPKRLVENAIGPESPNCHPNNVL